MTDIWQIAQQYLKPDFVILAAALYFLGIAIKRTQKIPNRFIPLLLLIAGILLAGLDTVSRYEEYVNPAAAILDTLTHGIVCAGMSVYVNQLFKQCTQCTQEKK